MAKRMYEMGKRKYIKKPKIYKDGLVDLRDIHIDTTLSVEEKMKSFIKQIKNPYRYRVGDIVVNISFADTNRTFIEALASVFKFYNRQ